MTEVKDERELVLEAVLGPASQSYYSERVKSGSSARLRAQAAQSTVTLFAGGLMAALTVTTLSDHATVTKVLGITAVTLWLLSALLYLRAVAMPVPDLTGTQHVLTRLDLVDAVLKKADAEAKRIDSRQRNANVVAGLALIASLASFALGVLVGPVDKVSPGTILVSQAYVSSARPVCLFTGGRVKGLVHLGTVDSMLVSVDVPAGVCGNEATALQIPRSSIIAIALEGGSGV